VAAGQQQRLVGVAHAEGQGGPDADAGAYSGKWSKLHDGWETLSSLMEWKTLG
jgi:hypothetical protein